MDRVALTRDGEAVQIPVRNRFPLEKGPDTFITQALGGTFTVQVPAYGGLFRIAGKDGDALGKKPADAGGGAIQGGDVEAMGWEELRTFYDPEIPVKIFYPGLGYGRSIQNV